MYAWILISKTLRTNILDICSSTENYLTFKNTQKHKRAEFPSIKIYTETPRGGMHFFLLLAILLFVLFKKALLASSYHAIFRPLTCLVVTTLLSITLISEPTCFIPILKICYKGFKGREGGNLLYPFLQHAIFL